MLAIFRCCESHWIKTVLYKTNFFISCISFVGVSFLKITPQLLWDIIFLVRNCFKRIQNGHYCITSLLCYISIFKTTDWAKVTAVHLLSHQTNCTKIEPYGEVLISTAFESFNIYNNLYNLEGIEKSNIRNLSLGTCMYLTSTYIIKTSANKLFGCFHVSYSFEIYVIYFMYNLVAVSNNYQKTYFMHFYYFFLLFGLNLIVIISYMCINFQSNLFIALKHKNLSTMTIAIISMKSLKYKCTKLNCVYTGRGGF